MPDSQRSIIDLDEESDQESDNEQVVTHDEIDRLRRLLAEERAEKEEKERLLAESEAAREQLAQEKAQREEQLSADTGTNGARGRAQFPTFDPKQT